MTRRTTLFLVCAFEIALILFVAAWSALAEEKQYTYPPANVRHLYEICNANDDLNAVYCLGHLNGIVDSLSMNCKFEKIFPAEDILVPTVNIKKGTTPGDLKNIFLGWAAQNKEEWKMQTSLAFGAFLGAQFPCKEK